VYAPVIWWVSFIKAPPPVKSVLTKRLVPLAFNADTNRLISVGFSIALIFFTSLGRILLLLWGLRSDCTAEKKVMIKAVLTKWFLYVAAKGTQVWGVYPYFSNTMQLSNTYTCLQPILPNFPIQYLQPIFFKHNTTFFNMDQNIFKLLLPNN